MQYISNGLPLCQTTFKANHNLKVGGGSSESGVEDLKVGWIPKSMVYKSGVTDLKVG